MRKLVLILIAFIAVAAFIRAYDNLEHNSVPAQLQNGVKGSEKF
jgi:hypothetical protein